MLVTVALTRAPKSDSSKLLTPSPTRRGRLLLVNDSVMIRILAMVMVMVGCGEDAPPALPTQHAAPLSEISTTVAPVPITPWLRDHFKTPIPAQGPAPDGWSEAESGLQPEDCGTCHVQQYTDWKESWHAMGMGPGMMGQLVHLDGDKDHQVAQCQSCHAPLTEQAPRIRVDSEDGSSEWIDNVDYIPSERTKGLTCVGCHVRSHQRHGPGNSGTLLTSKDPLGDELASALPHGGAEIRAEFKSPAFCRPCHDFDEKLRIGIDFSNGPDPDEGVVLSGVKSGSAAETAGIKIGDRVLSINGETVYTGADIKDHVELSDSQSSLLVRLRRDGDYLSLKLTPVATRSRPYGKMLQETTEEWRRTRFAAEGTTCQDCHMPAGRHLWKGIHDPSMVRSGLSLSASMEGSEPAEGFWAQVWGTMQLSASLTATNVGAGHRLPTYTTPEIHLIMQQLDAAGAPIEGTRQQTTIARRMKPSDLSVELYDTRLLPDESLTLYYSQALHGKADSLRAWVEVWPDEAYRRNYKSWLDHGRFESGHDQLEKAMQASIDSRYVLWTQNLSL
jgi:hypothetical protein